MFAVVAAVPTKELTEIFSCEKRESAWPGVESFYLSVCHFILTSVHLQYAYKLRNKEKGEVFSNFVTKERENTLVPLTIIIVMTRSHHHEN